jgi:hypothetical protein
MINVPRLKPPRPILSVPHLRSSAPRSRPPPRPVAAPRSYSSLAKSTPPSRRSLRYSKKKTRAPLYPGLISLQSTIVPHLPENAPHGPVKPAPSNHESLADPPRGLHPIISSLPHPPLPGLPYINMFSFPAIAKLLNSYLFLGLKAANKVVC